MKHTQYRDLLGVLSVSWAIVICSSAQQENAPSVSHAESAKQTVLAQPTNSAPISAPPITTINGITYRNYAISSVESDAVIITFWGGTKRIPFSDLSVHDRARFSSDETGSSPAKHGSFPRAEPERRSPIANGFEKVRWGNSISDIMKAYPNVRESSEVDGAYLGAKVGEAHFQNQAIQKMAFTVGEKGLCAVSVDYNPQWLLRNMEFPGSFVQKYGKAEHQEVLSNEMADGTRMSTLVQAWSSGDTALLLMYAVHKESGFISLNARYTDNTHRPSESPPSAVTK